MSEKVINNAELDKLLFKNLHIALKNFCTVLGFEIVHIFIMLHITKYHVYFQFQYIQQKSMEVTEA